MFKWFRDCKTAEEGKQLYRELAKKFHPDNGGSGIELKEIISEFKIWWLRFKDIHANSDGKTYKSERETTETAEEFIEIIENLSSIPGISVELCGSWLWITGNTYSYREQLKLFGCRWSKGHKKWYWTKDEYRRQKGHNSMAEIRFKYGSEQVHLNARPCLE